MYKLNWEIRIDGKRLALMEQCTINQSVESLVSTATIKLPRQAYNSVIAQSETFRRGQTVVIQLGYDDNLREEFKGFIKTVDAQDNGLELLCEDNMYIFNNTLLKDKTYTKPTVKKILEEVAKQVNPEIKVECDYTFSYDKFTFQTASGLDVLKMIQEECGCGVYLINNTLHCHPVYTENFGSVEYDTAKNVQADGFSLKYKSQADRRLKVVAKGKNSAGKDIECDPVGEGGGDTVTFNYKGIADKKMLTSIAQEIYNRKSYDGYEGTFQGWLLPYCGRGYHCKLSNAQEPERNGSYFIVSVETSVSASGGVRKVELGKRLSQSS